MKRQQSKGQRTAMVVLSSIAGVLVLIICIGVVGGMLMDSEDEPSATPTTAATVGTRAGIPPEPDADNWAAYIAELKKIDPDIVHGKEEKAIDRGRNQCSSVKEWPDDQEKLVDLTNRRFTSPDHPEGFGKAKAAKILAAVRKYICPTY